MRQDFNHITEDRLSELFPVILEPHNPVWLEQYILERGHLISIFGDKIIRINHIGSTSVNGLIAKPTIDILLEVSNDTDIDIFTERMKEEGYVINTPQSDIIMYLKGYTPQGFEGQCIHIHVRYYGEWDELYFRDYLLEHPEVAEEYGDLKTRLKNQFTNNRDGYTEAKTDFVREYSEIARKEFPRRYQVD